MKTSIWREICVWPWKYTLEVSSYAVVVILAQCFCVYWVKSGLHCRPPAMCGCIICAIIVDIAIVCNRYNIRLGTLLLNCVTHPVCTSCDACHVPMCEKHLDHVECLCNMTIPYCLNQISSWFIRVFLRQNSPLYSMQCTLCPLFVMVFMVSIPFLNQARAWFLKIDSVWIIGVSVCVCVCLCVRP